MKQTNTTPNKVNNSTVCKLVKDWLRLVINIKKQIIMLKDTALAIIADTFIDLNMLTF